MKAVIVRAMSQNRTYLFAVLIAATGLAIVLLLAPVSQLNRRSLAASRQLVALDLKPGWWLQPPSEPVCTLPDELALSRTALQARSARIAGVHALACGERTQAAAFLQQAATVLSNDKSLSLLLASATQRLALPGRQGEDTVSVGWGTVLDQARSAYDAGRREEAAAWLDTVHAEISAPVTADRRTLYFGGCYMYRSARRLADSLQACSNYVDVAPDSAEAWLGLGLTLQLQKQSAEAVTAFTRSIELDSTAIAPRISLGRLLLAQGSEAEAIDQFKAVAALAPTEPWSRYFLAAFALEGADCVAAKDHIHIAMKDVPPSLRDQVEQLQQRIQEACP